MKWDKGLDFESTYNKLVQIALVTNRETTKAYSLILLLQLRNGARISEAVRAFKVWLSNPSKKEVEIRVSKKKKEESRLMEIPKEFLKFNIKDFEWVKDVEEKDLIDRVKTFAFRNKINTHSLRYSFVTYLLKKGINPSIVAKITHHSNLNYILTYTQQKEAEKALREVNK
ncbi:MAG: tyrosine-type recombinase/integrase [Candidatus Micrarchaeia archaeon]|jgi:integrase